MKRFSQLFPNKRALIGVIHLPPLPGSPEHEEPIAEICSWAAEETRTLVKAGFDGVIVENFGDAPFFPATVPPVTVAAMTAAGLAVRQTLRELNASMAMGINVLRNDAVAALAIAKVVGAHFIRVNVHTGAAVTDQGLVLGQAHHTLRERRALGATQVAIFTDILVKHAEPLAPLSLVQAAKDTWLRGGSDGLILSGQGTGSPTSVENLQHARHAAPGAPLLVGSGARLESLSTLFQVADAVIVGTAIKAGGEVTAPIDSEKAKAFHALRETLG